MAQEIRWSAASSKDLESIFDFIARNSEDYARITVERIVDATDVLPRFPFIGREVPEYRDARLRELIVYSYRVIYRVDLHAIHIVGVIHGARRLKQALKGRRV